MRRNINLRGKLLAYALYAIGSVLALLLLIGAACSEGDVPSADAVIQSHAQVMAHSVVPHFGQTSMKERIANSDVIVHARLSAVDGAATELKESRKGMGALEFKFQAVEYLKGTGGNNFGVISYTDLNWDAFNTREEALQTANHWAAQRPVDWWENRDALLFLNNAGHWWTDGVGTNQANSSLFFFTLIEIGEFTIEDTKNRVWLPAVKPSASSGQPSNELRFLTEAPASMATAQQSTNSSVSISEMRTLIAEVDAVLAKGKGIQGYKECVQEKYRIERQNASTLGRTLLNPKVPADFESGLPAGSFLHSGRIMAALPGDENEEMWLTGKDASLFKPQISNVANENMASIIGVATISFDRQILSNRPIPAGTYRFNFIKQPVKLIPCNFYSNERVSEWIITVTAPVGTLHEAFFDPVAIGAGFGADATNGVLKPASFTPSGGSATTIDSIAWQGGQVKMRLTPHTTLADKHIDFLALDASVALRLDFDDATVVTEQDNTKSLTWGVCKQPWKAGDLLMLRISESEGDMADETNDAECLPATPTPTATPVPTATPIPTPTGPYITIGDATFAAEIADTPELRSKGLGERDSLPEQTGMLFVFPNGQASSFWMFGMRFPLDFVWIAEDCTVADLTENVQHYPPDTPSSELEIINPAYPAAYTFEINAGEVAQFGIEIGDSVQFHNINSEFAKCCENGACDGN